MIDLDSKVNIITLVYISKLGLKVYYTNIGAQKINNSTFEMFRIVLKSFQIEDKINRVWFFQVTFLLADINAKVILSMLSLLSVI